jgi:hypothetical protein
VRAMGWTEEQIQRHYPPCDCTGRTERRMQREMRHGENLGDP